MILFNVTYEIVTPKSAEHGDAEEIGFICEKVRLAQAIEEVQRTRISRGGGVECIEPSEVPGPDFRWITIFNGMEYETGAYESRSIHIPEQVTLSSRVRIARLLGLEIHR